MPMYSYLCGKCGHADDEFQRMADAHLTACPECAGAYVRQVTAPHTDLKEFSSPIEMFSIALDTEDEVRAFKLKCPDVEMQDDPKHPDFGLPIARNRKQKLAALKAVNYQEGN